VADGGDGTVRGRRRRRLDARRGASHRADGSAHCDLVCGARFDAVVELASAVGLVTLPGGELDPLGASTFGLGTVSQARAG
jgi:Glycerate kinase